LGLRPWMEKHKIEYIVTDDKEGANSTFDKHIPDADVIITTPFWPGYVTKERLAKAKNLKLLLTAGIGSDHIDLLACQEKGNLTVAEVTGCNVVSVAEHVIMQILVLIRNFVPSYKQVCEGGWDIAAITQKQFDLEGKVVGSVGAGRIGQRVLERLVPFNCKELLYTDYARLSGQREKELKARYVGLEELVKSCDVVTINCPLHKGTEHLFDKKLISTMKKGSYLVNTSRGKICKAEDVAEMLKNGHLAGYAGDVWYPQPAPKDHPWRTMTNHAMTPHMSGTSIDAQARYAKGVKDILEDFMQGKPIQEDCVMLEGKKLAPQYDPQADKNKRSLDFKQSYEKLL